MVRMVRIACGIRCLGCVCGGMLDDRRRAFSFSV